jgi:predicted peroxiredoxin
MSGKAVISLVTGLEDPEKVTVAFLVALGAAEGGRPTLMFLAKEAVRLAVNGLAKGVACAGCPPIPELVERYERAGGVTWFALSASTRSRSTRATSCPMPRSVAPSRCGSGSEPTGQQRLVTDGILRARRSGGVHAPQPGNDRGTQAC